MPDDPILDAFAYLERRHGSDALIVSPTNRATVEQVSSLADQVALQVRDLNLPSGSLVGLAAPNGTAFAAGYFGIRRADSRVLLLDWTTPHTELKRISTALASAATLTAGVAWPRSAAEFTLYHNRLSSEPEDLWQEATTIRLTSGSTGSPLGIAHSTETLLADDRALRNTMDLKEEIALAAIPLSHSYGFCSLFLPAITDGWTLVVPDGGGPFAPLSAANQGEITFLPSVPAFFDAILKMSQPPGLPSSLRLAISAGALLKTSTAAKFRQTYQQGIHVFYGAPEVAGITYDREGTAAERGTVGTPVEGVHLTLVDEEGELSESGIIRVESPAAALGYYPDSDPRLGGGRFITSDLGRVVGTELELLGRSDDLVNIRGKKVNPREIEDVLEATEMVDKAIVMGLPSPDGSGDLIAALVVTEPSRVQTAELRDRCRDRLAPHKVPRAILITREMPLTSRGKVDRKRASELLLDYLQRT